jgi:hypothetical protein
MTTLNTAKRLLLALALAALAAAHAGADLLARSPEPTERMQLACNGDSGNNCGGGPG